MTVTDHLIALKKQYENAIEAADLNAGHYIEQLVHINALLLDQLLPRNNGFVPSAILESPASTAAIPTALEPIVIPSTPSKSKVSKVVESRTSLPLLPEYQGMKKQEAIAKVLEEVSGQSLHMNDIIRLLYGELSPEALNVERVRMKSSLHQGTKQKLWQKASKPSCYFLKTTKAKGVGAAPTAIESKAKVKPSKASQSKALSKSSKAADTTPVSGPRLIGAKIILPMHKDFAGLSKIDAVLKVMQENAGKPVHIDTIIKRLFGPLSETEAKAEKGRMKNVMSRGREQGVWKKTSAPLSFIVSKA